MNEATLANDRDFERAVIRVVEKFCSADATSSAASTERSRSLSMRGLMRGLAARHPKQQ